MKGTTAESNHTEPALTLLASEMMKRMRQLNYSRRELAIRAGLSRQTLHHIEVGGRIKLQPSTLAALDAALQWPTGTAVELAAGNAATLNYDAAIEQHLANTYRWRIIQNLETLTLAELEAMILHNGWTLEDEANTP